MKTNIVFILIYTFSGLFSFGNIHDELNEIEIDPKPDYISRLIEIGKNDKYHEAFRFRAILILIDEYLPKEEYAEIMVLGKMITGEGLLDFIDKVDESDVSRWLENQGKVSVEIVFKWEKNGRILEITNLYLYSINSESENKLSNSSLKHVISLFDERLMLRGKSKSDNVVFKKVYNDFWIAYSEYLDQNGEIRLILTADLQEFLFDLEDK